MRTRLKLSFYGSAPATIDYCAVSGASMNCVGKRCWYPGGGVTRSHATVGRGLTDQINLDIYLVLVESETLDTEGVDDGETLHLREEDSITAEFTPGETT